MSANSSLRVTASLLTMSRHLIPVVKSTLSVAKSVYRRKTGFQIIRTTIFTVAVFIMSSSLMAQTAFRIDISDIDSVPRGGEVSVPVIKTSGSEDMHQFAFLISFDHGASTFIDATPGPIFDGTGSFQWEQFEARLDSFVYPVYDSTHPPAKAFFIEISGIADIDNGAHQPLTYQIPDGTVLFHLNFHISYNIQYSCNYLPIRFLWTGCADNTIEYESGGNSEIAVSRDVYDWQDYVITNPYLYSFPLYTGFPDDCFDSSAFGTYTPVRFVDFYNGSVDVLCDSTNPLRGDLNLNGLAYELADAALFANYFLEGSSVFTVSLDSQMTASDITGDLKPAQINDYVYLTGILAGDMPPGQIITASSYGVMLLEDVSSSLKFKGTFGVPIGGVALSFYATNATPYTVALLPAAADMDLAYEKIGDTLRILIHNDVALGGVRQAIDSGFGEFLQIGYTGVRPRLISVSAAGLNAEGIAIISPGDLNMRADLNMNGIAYEIADYIVFANYFLHGLEVFSLDINAQIPATDINADGLVLTIEDLIYLARVIDGTFLPIFKDGSAPEGEIIITSTDSSIIIGGNFSDSVGGLHFRFYAPDAMTPNAYRIYKGTSIDSSDFGYAIDDSLITILISHIGTPQAAIDSGVSELLEISFSQTEPQMIYASAATFLAQRMTLSLTPSLNNPPAFTSYNSYLINNHYGGFYQDFDAVDQNPLPDEVTYHLISGPGEIDLNTGLWTYAPLCRNVGDTFTLVVCASDYLHPCPQSDWNLHATVSLSVDLAPTVVGDANGTGAVELTDVLYIVSHLYKGGLPPLPVSEVGDVNGSGKLDILDVTYLIAYLYRGGPAPECP